MKETKLEYVYCVPKTKEELLLLNIDDRYATCGIKQCTKGLGTTLPDDEKILTEISVSKFLDLLNDRIVHWRLEELGFDVRGVDGDSRVLQITRRTVLSFDTITNEVWLGDLNVNITTFTELKQLIKFLKP